MSKVYVAELESISPISFSKNVNVPHLDGEGPADYEVRTWRERMHADSDGHVMITPMMFKNALSAAAKYLGEKIVGEGNKKWTKKFESGVMVLDPVVLPIKKDDVSGESLFVPSDGVRGGTKRVNRIFPRIDSWKGTVKFIIIDESLTSSDDKIFRRHLDAAGNFIGLGRFRPSQNGFYGRFKVNSLKLVNEAD
jgi:hypothetical protein